MLAVLESNLSPIMASCVLRYALQTIKADLGRLGPQEAASLMVELERGVRLYAPEAAARCTRQLKAVVDGLAGAGPRTTDPVAGGDGAAVAAPHSGLTVPILSESDIVVARHAGRELCAKLGFSRTEEVKAATVISELARNIVQYASKGEIALRTWSQDGRVGIEIRARDQGPGIPQLASILAGSYRSKTGLGLGIAGARKLAHKFEITTAPGKGTEIVARMALR